jgi:hypothetical protein
MGPSVVWAGKHYLVGSGAVGIQYDSSYGGFKLQGFCIARAGPDGKPLDAQAKCYKSLAQHQTSMGSAGGRALLIGTVTFGKRGDPSIVYGVLLDAEGAILADDNPGRPWPPCDWKRNFPHIKLWDLDESDVYGISVGGSGEWFLTANQTGAGGAVRCFLLRAKDGRVLVDGKMLTPQGACEKTPFVCGGHAGEFLLLYERNNQSDANQKVGARIVKVR